MLCNYETSCTRNGSGDERCPDGFSRCMNGWMIMVGIIAGLVLTAAVVLLFINGLLPSVFPAVLTVLITGVVAVLALTITALLLPDGSRGKKCLRCHLGGLFFGLIGLVVAALLTISTDLAADSVIAAVTLGLTAFFTAYVLVALLFVVRCAVQS